MMHESRMHLTEEELHDAASDHEADVDARASRHLGHCSTCRADVERIRGLLALAATLPRSIDPPRDLWPDIQGRIRTPTALQRLAPTAGPRRRWTSMLRDGRWLAAAAVLLIVASSGITALVLRAPNEGAAREQAAGTPASDVRNVGGFSTDEYDRLDRELAARIASERVKLQPETLAKVERNLAIIDAAIAEIREALREDPGNDALHRLLKASYGQKEALVRQVSQT